MALQQKERIIGGAARGWCPGRLVPFNAKCYQLCVNLFVTRKIPIQLAPNRDFLNRYEFRGVIS